MTGRERESVHRTIGDFSITVRSDSARVLEDFAAIYRGYPRRGSRPANRICIEVKRTGRFPMGGRRYTVRSDETDIYVDCRANEALPCLEWGINWRVITGCPQYLQLHAAALVRNGRAVVIVGPSGCGKSTLAAGLLSRGWAYLTDEIAMVEPATLTVRAFPKALCVKGGAFELVRELNLPLWQGRHYVKALKGPVAYVNPRQVGREAVAEAAPMGLVVLLRQRCEQGPQCFPISPAQAVFRLTGQTLNRDAFGAGAVPVLAEIARRVECVGLDSGPLEQTCALLERLADGRPTPGQLGPDHVSTASGGVGQHSLSR